MNDVRIRKMDFPFDDSIPKHWMGGSILGTHLANSLNLLFPLGERFFMRSVRNYLDRIDDPELVRQVRGFFGQEGMHAREHERFFEILRAQGFDIDTFLASYDRAAFGILEVNTPPELRLAVTVACEHFTAMFAERALSRELLDHVHPVMRDLLRWHASEEIEHKSVAFDVLMKVDPSYRTRILGLVLATVGLTAFWMLGARALIAQEPEATPRRLVGELFSAVRGGHVGRGAMAKAFVSYLRPGFHPSQIENDHLARTYLAGIAKRSAQ